jgi:F-type H+-transporting ATPase subunit alpha
MIYDSDVLTNSTDFLAHLKSNEADLLSTITKEGALSKELEERLKTVVQAFVNSFL